LLGKSARKKHEHDRFWIKCSCSSPVPAGGVTGSRLARTEFLISESCTHRNSNTVIQIIINGIILIGLWRGLSRTDFTARTRVAVWLVIAVPLTLWAALVRQLAVQGIFFRPIPGVTRVLPALPVAIFVPEFWWGLSY
jgi:hypothetical protein